MVNILRQYPVFCYKLSRDIDRVFLGCLFRFRYASNFPPYAGVVVEYDKNQADSYIIKSYYSPAKEIRSFTTDEDSMLPFCPFETLISTFVMTNDKKTNERVRESQRWLTETYGSQLATDRNMVYELSDVSISFMIALNRVIKVKLFLRLRFYF